MFRARVRCFPHVFFLLLVNDFSQINVKIVDKYKVNTFYTAPTAIRALMREGDGPVKNTSRKSLKLLGTVGKPINPEAWLL